MTKFVALMARTTKSMSAGAWRKHRLPNSTSISRESASRNFFCRHRRRHKSSAREREQDGSDTQKSSQKISTSSGTRIAKASQRASGENEKFKWKREKILVIQLQLCLTFATFNSSPKWIRVVESSQGGEASRKSYQLQSHLQTSPPARQSSTHERSWPTSPSGAAQKATKWSTWNVRL